MAERAGSARDAVERAAAAMARWPGLNAVTGPMLESALADADRQDGGVEAGPLGGWTVGVKANIDVAGQPTTAGLASRAQAVAAVDAPVVRRVRDAGALIVGTTNCHEGAIGATTDNAAYGRAMNPHRDGYTPGGSSGGSAAAVAAGLCRVALGTDTLGSIRIPASYCGIYGLKTTWRAVQTAGLVPLTPRFDSIGPLARSVADLGVITRVLMPVADGVAVAQVATLSSVSTHAMHPAVAAAYGRAAELLAGLGVAVAEHATAFMPGPVAVMAFAEMMRSAAEVFADDVTMPGGTTELFRTALAFGTGFDEAAMAQARGVTDTAAGEVMAVLATADAILLPSTPYPAHAQDAGGASTAADFTCLANLTGCPSLALPAGWTDDGLPVGVQLMGRHGEEGRLLAVAARLDAALGAYRPPAGF